MKFGIDSCKNIKALRHYTFSLLSNSASVDSSYTYSHVVLQQHFGKRLQSLLAPQHGFFQEEQANMLESEHGYLHELPLYSLYSETRRPTAKMLEKSDILVVDLQDVGTRVYTFIWTLKYCLEFAQTHAKKVIVLDRPNPIGGITYEGNILDITYRSFVGEAPIPMRHGLTIGEMALFLNASIGADLDIICMEGWSRSDLFLNTGRLWLPTSPNLPTVRSLIPYVGTVLLEGTNLSEGRGTTTPFEIIGAPYLNGDHIANYVNSFYKKPCVIPIRFVPTFDKWQGKICQGIRFLSSNNMYELVVKILHFICAHYSSYFEWLSPPYEYEYDKYPIDIITGGSNVRLYVEGKESALEKLDICTWAKNIEPYLLYA